MKPKENTISHLKQKILSIPLRYRIGGVFLLFGFILALFSFAGGYQRLDNELREERIVYINEISNQISDSVYLQREKLIAQIVMSANTLNYIQANTFSDLRRLYQNWDNGKYTVVLVDSSGQCYGLDGSPFPIQNNEQLKKTLQSGNARYFFEKSTDGNDYWVFSKGINTKNIDGHNMVALYELYNVEQFQSMLSLQLFDDVGAAFIINRDGTIGMRPTDGNMELGYNVVSSFETMGLSPEAAQTIRNDLADNKSNRLYVKFDHAEWLVDYRMIADSDEFVMIVVPIGITSAGVTNGLRLTLIGVGGTIICIAVLLLLVIRHNAIQAQIRNRQIYDMELAAKLVESKNDFLAKMSHDIRTPLNAIIGMNYIATTQVEKDAPVVESLSNIETSAQYLLSILNDILDMSKIESGKMELHEKVFELKEMIREVQVISESSARDKGIIFEIHCAEEVGSAFKGDVLRITQIIMNLTSNAIKFTPAGGHVRVDIQAEDIEESENLQKLSFVVADDGIGMSEEFLDSIFTPFTQEGPDTASQYGGSGLGMSIVKNFVDIMGGTISVTSKKGEGSTFNVNLPLEKAENTKGVEDSADMDKEHLPGKRVLLVEDNPINRKIANKLLTMEEMQVEEAENGRLALALFEERPPGYYAIIITDIRMPELDGYGLADAIRHSSHPDGKDIPIIAMSANAFDEDIEMSLAHGMNAHLKKPVEVAVLKRTLCVYVAKEDGHEAETH